MLNCLKKKDFTKVSTVSMSYSCWHETFTKNSSFIHGEIYTLILRSLGKKKTFSVSAGSQWLLYHDIYILKGIFYGNPLTSFNDVLLK